ncbi:MAG: hypothetical protein PHN38_09635 [Sulfurospirillaceae bacterium]|nr:hypothetical protein [Sulfurospirillaceae bacterium]
MSPNFVPKFDPSVAESFMNLLCKKSTVGNRCHASTTLLFMKMPSSDMD